MMGGFGMGFTSIFWVGIIILILVLVWRHLNQKRHLGNSKDSPLDVLLGTPENSPLEILKVRYARGEIDKEEYEEKKKDLI